MIRLATEADAARLLEIYAYYVEKTAVSFEYDVPTLPEFTARIRRTLARYPYLVAEQDGRIVGYAYAGMFRPRLAYGHAVEATVYVDRAARHSGVGRALYQALFAALARQNITNVYACISSCAEEDEYLTHDSAKFHARMGFTPVGTFHRCGYKLGRWYDTLWMEKLIAPHTETPPAVVPFPTFSGAEAKSCEKP